MELEHTFSFGKWATPISHAIFHIGNPDKRSNCSLFWLSHTDLLVWYTSGDGCLRWEHLNTRTSNRYQERRFGKTLVQYRPTGRGGHFEPQALSPDAQWLLGFRQAPNVPLQFEAIGTGGRRQTWPGKETQGCPMFWLPGNRRWCCVSKEGERLTGFWLYRLGRTKPEYIRPHNMPPADENAFVIGVTPHGTAILASGNIAHPHGASHGPAVVYAVQIRDGAVVKRIGALVLPRNLDCINIELSPKGTHFLLQCDQRFEGGAACFAVCRVDGKNFKVVGQLPQDRNTSGDWDGIRLVDFAWHLDNKKISFMCRNQKGHQLYVAQT